MAISKITSAGVATDTLVAGDIAAGAVGTSEIATGGVLPANIAYLGDGSGNLSGTITNQQLHFGTAFTLTDDLTINGDVTLAKVRDDGLGQSITGSGRTLTGTGTLTMGNYVEGEPKAGRVTSVDGMTGVMESSVTGIPAAGITGVLPVGVTGGSGLDAVSAGITEADIWVLGTQFSGTASEVVAIERSTVNGFTLLGTGMTEDGDTGILTFPSTGRWLIKFVAQWELGTGSSRYLRIGIKVDTGSGLAVVAETRTWLEYIATQAETSCYVDLIFNVSNVSTHKVAFTVTPFNSAIVTLSTSTIYKTYFTFIKLS